MFINYRWYPTRYLMLALFSLLGAASGFGQTREEKVREDRRKVEADGFWIYNDWELARAEAQQSGKPILVVLRCIPCEECVKLDDHLVDQDAELRPLLEQFVRVRLVSTNGLDLSLFQYDFDQSFAMFMLNADGAIYGRFGTRSHRTEWVGDVSLQGLARALESALAIHANYPSNRDELAGKRGGELEFSSPEEYPSLRDKYSSELAVSGEIVKSCIHCHQIGDAQREFYRNQRQAIPETILFPYPHPTTIGLTLDPRETARVRSVAADSAAERAGLQAGDLIAELNGQPILSTADVQWVLHHANPAGEALVCEIVRGEQSRSLSIELDDGWRREGDLSWRASTWGLRRMASGGMLLQSLSDEELAERRLTPDQLALRVKHVGQFGAHATAKKAGVLAGDILVQFADRSDAMTESELLAYAVNHFRPGTKVPVSLLRDGQRREIQLLMQP